MPAACLLSAAAQEWTVSMIIFIGAVLIAWGTAMWILHDAVYLMMLERMADAARQGAIDMMESMP
jgi:hypothetical protein